MNFSTVKAITIPEGSVKKITCGDIVWWEKSIAFTNLLPFATDLDRVTIYNGVGYKTNTRLSSSTSTVGKAVAFTGMCTSGFIPCKEGDVLRIKGISHKSGTASYIIAFDSANAMVGYKAYSATEPTITLDSTTFGTGFNAIRFSAGVIDESTIVTINEEIPA